MKGIIFILFLSGCLIGISPSLNAQEKIFHDLKGLEDSSGTTHLFHRLYTEKDPDEYYYDLWENHVSHINTVTWSDSIKFKSYQQRQISASDNVFSVTQDFIFLDNNPIKWFLANNRLGTYSNAYGYIRGYNQSFFHAGWNYVSKVELFRSDTLNYGVYNFENSSIVNIIKEDSLPSVRYNYPVLVKASNDSDDGYYCPNGESKNCFYGKSDSVLIYNHNFLSIDQHQKGGIYFQRNDSLFWSDDLGKTMNFINKAFSWSLMDSFLFGDEDSTIIVATRFKFSPLRIMPDSANYYQVLKSTDAGHSWEEIWGDSSKIYLSPTLKGNGIFYFGNENTVYESTNYGESSSELLTFNHPITGLYKKPNSDILYVLTTEELLEVNTETKESTSLKKLPVSNEREPSEIPNQISLEQNYPNPFNPSTVISYQLNSNSLVRLEVFDVTGRKVAILVNGKRKSAGKHDVTFKASGLSSGVYFYRLEAGGQTITQKMLLVK